MVSSNCNALILRIFPPRIFTISKPDCEMVDFTSADALSPIAVTIITAATPMTTPSNDKILLVLFVRNDCIALIISSVILILR